MQTVGIQNPDHPGHTCNAPAAWLYVGVLAKVTICDPCYQKLTPAQRANWGSLFKQPVPGCGMLTRTSGGPNRDDPTPDGECGAPVSYVYSKDYNHKICARCYEDQDADIQAEYLTYPRPQIPAAPASKYDGLTQTQAFAKRVVLEHRAKLGETLLQLVEAYGRLEIETTQLNDATSVAFRFFPEMGTTRIIGANGSSPADALSQVLQVLALGGV